MPPPFPTAGLSDAPAPPDALRAAATRSVSQPFSYSDRNPAAWNRYAEIYLTLLDSIGSAAPTPPPNTVAPRALRTPLAMLVKVCAYAGAQFAAGKWSLREATHSQ